MSIQREFETEKERDEMIESMKGFQKGPGWCPLGRCDCSTNCVAFIPARGFVKNGKPFIFGHECGNPMLVGE